MTETKQQRDERRATLAYEIARDRELGMSMTTARKVASAIAASDEAVGMVTVKKRMVDLLVAFALGGVGFDKDLIAETRHLVAAYEEQSDG